MNDFYIRITDEENRERLDKILTEKIGGSFSRNRIQNIIKSGFLTKNGEIFFNDSYKVKIGEEFSILLNETEDAKIEEKDIKLDIIYEDNDLIIVNKQAGLSTHPGCGNYDNTLVNALLFHKKNQLSGIGGVIRPGIVHRLDKDTSGLMVVAKNDFAHKELTEQLKSRILKRTYNAFVWGCIFPPVGKIDGYMERSKFNRLKMVMVNNVEARYSLTSYKTLENFSNTATLVECKLDTGRTHQIRLHFSNKKFPLIGDQLYGGNCRKVKGEKTEFIDFIENFPRQALISKKISLIQPTTKELLEFEVDFPEDLRKLYSILKML